MSTYPLPSPPFFNIPNIANLRDASYSLSTPQGKLRQGILFRSAEVVKLDAAGWVAVHQLGVAHVFDLRSESEVAKGWSNAPEPDGPGQPKDSSDKRNDERDDNVSFNSADPDWLRFMHEVGVSRTWVPVFLKSDYSPEKIALRYQKYMDADVQGFVGAYRDILKSGGPAYRTILQYLVTLDASSGRQAQGALVHCTAGKDRTGVFFGVLFDFLGVPRSQIADEYNLTEPGLAVVREEIVPRLLKSPGFVDYMRGLQRDRGEKEAAGEETDEFSPDVLEQGRQAALRMVGARKESMLATLEIVDAEFGGSEKYMREYCGLGDEELEKLKRTLVAKA